MKKKASQNSNLQKKYTKNQIKSILLQILHQSQAQRQTEIRQLLEKQKLLLKQQIIHQLKKNKTQHKEIQYKFNHKQPTQLDKNQRVYKQKLDQHNKYEKLKLGNTTSKQKTKNNLELRIKDIVNYNQQLNYRDQQQHKILNDFEQKLFKEQKQQNRYQYLKNDEKNMNKFHHSIKKKLKINQSSKKSIQQSPLKTNSKKNHTTFLTPQKKLQNFQKSPSRPIIKSNKSKKSLTPSKSVKLIGIRENREEIAENLPKQTRQKIYTFFQNINGKSYLYK